MMKILPTMQLTGLPACRRPRKPAHTLEQTDRGGDQQSDLWRFSVHSFFKTRGGFRQI